ncbi:response regulator [Dethiothermospora halolimnae]|uniref:response regulator n=1 Tax=Dethiothermospora halolimnae TaxID=3114390 RepID=UPI003CCBD984
MSILIVDDTIFMRSTIKKYLEESDIGVVGEASNGVEAVEKYKELNPSVVTMDITMPHMGGVEAIKRIVEYDSDANIIVCSSMGQEDVVMNAIKAGAKTFIVKPFEKSRLLDEINRVINV